MPSLLLQPCCFSQADSPQADSTQADSTQADSPQADSPQADSTQADSTQADSTQADSSQANNPHQLKDVATSDAALQNNTETASLKEELGAVKVSVSDSEARNAELQTKLESALAKVAAVKANSKPLKVCALLCFS